MQLFGKWLIFCTHSTIFFKTRSSTPPLSKINVDVVTKMRLVIMQLDYSRHWCICKTNFFKYPLSGYCNFLKVQQDTRLQQVVSHRGTRRHHTATALKPIW